MKKIVCASLLLSCSGLVLLSGCRRQNGAQNPVSVTNAAVKKAVPPPAVVLPPAELKKLQVNELGMIPVLEYHEIGTGKGPMFRTVEQFKKDLDRLYKIGFYPVTMREYLDNRIDLPAGKSPVILSFDDSRGTQFRYKPDGSLDPDCAIAILQDFNKQHPDFPLKGIFYLLPKRAFDQPAFREKKVEALMTMGFELGNHTVTHRLLRRLSDENVKKEIAEAVSLTHELAPEAKLDTLALPGGVMPRNRALLASGSFGDAKYSNRAVFLAGAAPAHAPASQKFKPMAIPRVLAVEGLMGITYWLDRLKAEPGLRYVSDGDASTITIPKREEKRVEKKHLNGAKLRVY